MCLVAGTACLYINCSCILRTSALLGTTVDELCYIRALNCSEIPEPPQKQGISKWEELGSSLSFWAIQQGKWDEMQPQLRWPKRILFNSVCPSRHRIYLLYQFVLWLSHRGSQPAVEAMLHKHEFEERKSMTMKCLLGLAPSVCLVSRCCRCLSAFHQ